MRESVQLTAVNIAVLNSLSDQTCYPHDTHTRETTGFDIHAGLVDINAGFEGQDLRYARVLR